MVAYACSLFKDFYLDSKEEGVSSRILTYSRSSHFEATHKNDRKIKQRQDKYIKEGETVTDI